MHRLHHQRCSHQHLAITASDPSTPISLPAGRRALHQTSESTLAHCVPKDLTCSSAQSRSPCCNDSCLLSFQGQHTAHFPSHAFSNQPSSWVVRAVRTVAGTESVGWKCKPTRLRAVCCWQSVTVMAGHCLIANAMGTDVCKHANYARGPLSPPYMQSTGAVRNIVVPEPHQDEQVRVCRTSTNTR